MSEEQVQQDRKFTDQEILSGYAFKPHEKELQEYVSRRYHEICEVAKDGIKMTKRPDYGRTHFSGELLTDAAKALTSADLAIYADGGNLCFGGHCTKSGNHFSGCYWID